MAGDNTSGVKTAEKQLPGIPFTKDDPRINREGRPKGSGISITTEIKKKLEEVHPTAKATYLQLLINRIFKQAIQDGDQQMIKNIWNYVDGMPIQRNKLEMTDDLSDILDRQETDYASLGNRAKMMLDEKNKTEGETGEKT